MQFAAENLELLRQGFLDYSGGSLLWILYAVSVLYLAFFAGKEGRRLVVWPLALTLITVLNPLLLSIVGDFANRVPRLFWFLIYYIVIGYALMHVITHIKYRWLQYLLWAAVLAAVVFIGNPPFAQRDGLEFKVAENASFASDELETLSSLYHSEGIAEPKVLYGSMLMQYMRTYDPTIISEASRQLTVGMEQGGYVRDYIKEHDDMYTLVKVFFENKRTVPKEDFAAACVSRHIDYVTPERDSLLEDYVASCGFEKIGKTENYSVFRVMAPQSDERP